MVEELLARPRDQVGGRVGLESAGDVQGAGALVRGDRVPDAARHVEHVARVQDQVGDRLLGRLGGLGGVAVEGVRAGGAVQAPVLAAVELDDDGVVVVPVDAEAFGARPGGVEVGLDAGAEDAFDVLGEAGERAVHLVHGVQDEGGAVGEAGVQVGGAESTPDRVPAGGDRLGVVADVQGRAALVQPHPGRFQPLRGHQLVEVVPGHQPGNVHGGGEVAVVAVQCLGEEVLAQARRDRRRRHRVEGPFRQSLPSLRPVPPPSDSAEAVRARAAVISVRERTRPPGDGAGADGGRDGNRHGESSSTSMGGRSLSARPGLRQ
ncbi:hypothetical protein GCM10020295_83410 [Streptomyces cinereospinus]